MVNLNEITTGIISGVGSVFICWSADKLREILSGLLSKKNGKHRKR